MTGLERQSSIRDIEREEAHFSPRGNLEQLIGISKVKGGQYGICVQYRIGHFRGGAYGLGVCCALQYV